MIHRYRDPRIEVVFSDDQRLSLWTRIELVATQEQIRAGILHPSCSWEAPSLDPAHFRRLVAAHEARTHHDVAAFVAALVELTGQQAIHYGMTSSDVVDTALGIQIQAAGTETINRAQLVLGQIDRWGDEWPRLWAGRTHTQLAFALRIEQRLDQWADRIHRALHQLQRSVEAANVAKLSGPAGQWDGVEEAFAARLGMGQMRSVQAIPRDIYSQVVVSLARLGNAYEQLATDLRLLCSSDIGELRYRMDDGMIGSSSMPHKSNPIPFETTCGLARVLRGYSSIAQENTTWWLERDIAHSSAERIVIPDAFHLACTMAMQLMAGMTRLEPTSQINDNLGQVPDSAHKLLEAIRAGAARDQVYTQYKESAIRVESHDKIQ